MIEVTNNEFISALAGDLGVDERFWCTSFPESPSDATASAWSGRPYSAGELLPTAGNTYFATAALAAGGRRAKASFRRQFAMVVDDPAIEAIGLPATYMLETSPGKFQVGYKLRSDDAQTRDVERMSAAVNALAANGLVPKDRSGNNPVRYVRLPGGTNTKPRESGPFSHVLHVWAPDRVYSVAEVLTGLGVTRTASAEGPAVQAPGGQWLIEPRADDAELIRRIATAESFHDPLLKLTARYRHRGMSPDSIVETISGLMLASAPAEGTADHGRWQARCREITRMVRGAEQFAPAAAAAELRREGPRQKPILDEANVRIVLEHDPALGALATYNEFSGRLVLNRPVPGRDGSVVAERDTPRPWTDADAVMLAEYIQRTALPRIGRDKVQAVLEAHARSNCAVHPLREYLQSLEWDGRPRVLDWLTTYARAGSGQSAAYLQATGSRFLVSAVARVLRPGCQVDSALVLEGRQGAGKSSGLRILAGDEYFSDSLPADLHEKDASQHLLGKWIVELPELAQFRRNEIETVKAFLSRREERFRPPYGRNEVTVPRQCVFAGSTNAEHYLVDSTGNRRFWCVAVGEFDLDGLRRDRDQIWAEAAHLYRQGAQWHLEGDIARTAAAEAESRVATDPWVGIVDELLKMSLLKDSETVAPGEVLRHMNLRDEQRNARAAARVGECLRSLGWQRGARHKTRGQLYVRAVG